MEHIENTLDKAAALIQRGQYREAESLLLGYSDQSQWDVIYLRGQCRRFLNDFQGATSLLKEAASVAPSVAPVFLALGIAQQLNGEFQAACLSLFQAIRLDGDYALAFNSLALTQKLLGEFDKSLHNYDAGCFALTRKIVKQLRNDRTSPIAEDRHVTGRRWFEYAKFGAMFLIENDPFVHSMITPDYTLVGVDPDILHRHGGDYWADELGQGDEVVRLYLPNYFNSFQKILRLDRTYADLTGNRGTLLHMLGRDEEANAHFAEAKEFLPSSVH
jgi:tetratricopeptide (TPR) repeat protein